MTIKVEPINCPRWVYDVVFCGFFPHLTESVQHSLLDRLATANDRLKAEDWDSLWLQYLVASSGKTVAAITESLKTEASPDVIAELVESPHRFRTGQQLLPEYAEVFNTKRPTCVEELCEMHTKLFLKLLKEYTADV